MRQWSQNRSASFDRNPERLIPSVGLARTNTLELSLAGTGHVGKGTSVCLLYVVLNDSVGEQSQRRSSCWPEGLKVEVRGRQVFR